MNPWPRPQDDLAGLFFWWVEKQGLRVDPYWSADLQLQTISACGARDTHLYGTGEGVCVRVCVGGVGGGNHIWGLAAGTVLASFC